ncbi:MAG: helix-turn-helix domain-containing protein, partial [Weeksellaceae bacterium]
ISCGGRSEVKITCPPHEIRNLEDRLRSRFSGGLIVDIQNPDFELRTAILLIKATEKNIAIDIEAATAIAETILDTRSLEGMLLSLYARTLGVKDRIDLLVVEDFFKQKTTTAKKRFTAQDVIKCVCSYYDIKAAHIKSATRKSSVAHARQVIMYLLRSELDINLGEIAYMVKRKDHTTVIHAINKITKETMKDKEFAEEIDVIRKTIHAST